MVGGCKEKESALQQALEGHSGRALKSWRKTTGIGTLGSVVQHPPDPLLSRGMLVSVPVFVRTGMTYGLQLSNMTTRSRFSKLSTELWSLNSGISTCQVISMMPTCPYMLGPRRCAARATRVGSGWRVNSYGLFLFRSNPWGETSILGELSRVIDGTRNT